MSDIPSARLVLLKDADKCKKDDSVRMTGIWKTFDPTTKIAVIHYKGFEVEIDTTKSLQSLPEKEDIVQCLGEVVQEAAFGVLLRLDARIIRIVNTLDLELYEQVVELRNSVI